MNVDYVFISEAYVLAYRKEQWATISLRQAFNWTKPRGNNNLNRIPNNTTLAVL